MTKRFKCHLLNSMQLNACICLCFVCVYCLYSLVRVFLFLIFYGVILTFSVSVTLCIVSRGDWLGKPANFKDVCYCSSFFMVTWC